MDTKKQFVTTAESGSYSTVRILMPRIVIGRMRSLFLTGRRIRWKTRSWNNVVLMGAIGLPLNALHAMSDG